MTQSPKEKYKLGYCIKPNCNNPRLKDGHTVCEKHFQEINHMTINDYNKTKRKETIWKI